MISFKVCLMARFNRLGKGTYTNFRTVNISWTAFQTKTIVTCSEIYIRDLYKRTLLSKMRR